ncbi:protein kinase [Streptomyces sp. NPDC002889]|uniref:protein kinase domain-containing protein n=1 Tax=Streptomyces sp. NPDC002889 TaxID=3364669 RepID=UPI0036CCE5A8
MQPLDPGEPRSIGAYRLLGRLGAGGMGRVYLGRSAGGRTVAVKIVHPHFSLDEEFRARFRREVAAARRVGGEWTAPVLDADPDATLPWVATGYVAGPPLSQAVADHGPLPDGVVRALGAGLAQALAAVHALDLVHRDVKPSNVLLTLEGPRLIDFGIARATEGTASLTSTGVSVGSPGYMSPEQILGKGVTGAADVFSLGAVLAYAATGEAPFPGDSSAALLYRVVHGEPELGSLDGEMRGLVAGCLAKDPAARPTPDEIVARLAPDGVAAMIGVGRLPGLLVEQISRAAVELLNLEALTEPDPVVSGPVAFSSAAIGVFGPPVEPPRPGPLVADSAPQPSADAEVPSARTPETGTGAGPSIGFSVSASTAMSPDTDGARRGRRISCTVALTVAGALAAVTIGSGVLQDLWRGSPDAQKGSDTAARPPASTGPAETPTGATPSGSSSTAPGTAPRQVGAVPAAFVGTWQGEITQDNGLSGGMLTAVITKGRKGKDVIRTSVKLGPFECNGVGKLASGTERELRITERTDPDRPTSPLCTSGTTTVTYTLTAKGTVRYRSQEEAAGNPYATLVKKPAD